MRRGRSVSRWYAGGLRFQCTACGACCTGPGGAVWLSDEDEARLSRTLSVSKETLRAQYLRKLFGKYILKEGDSDGRCIFLKEQRCIVYEARPDQCKSYPWWPSLLESPERWTEESRRCEGINAEAPLVSLEEIDARSR